MKHPLTIEKYSGTLTELAKELGNLRYDSLVVVLRALQEDLYRQAEADKGRGRPQLAGQLQSASSDLEKACEHIGKAWKISEPYMKE